MSFVALSVPKKEKYPSPLAATIDHINPTSRGGSNGIENLGLAHHGCNHVKGDRLGVIDGFMRTLQRLIRTRDRDMLKYEHLQLRYSRFLAEARPRKAAGNERRDVSWICRKIRL